MDKIIIIGSGLAGYTLVRELRKNNPDVPICLITQDNGDNYYKPNLSCVLAKQQTPEQLILNRATDMAAKFNIELMTHTEVSHIDPVNQIIKTNKKSINYSKLVLCLGAKTNNLNLPKEISQSLYSVNSLKDYKLFYEAIKQTKHLTIIGSGLIGCEFANDLASQVKKIDIISATKTPLTNLVPELIADKLYTVFQQQGITWHLNKDAETIDDNAIEANAVILSAVGLTPNIKLAQTADIDCARGIIVDHYFQTSQKNIYALGDCVEYDDCINMYVMPITLGARNLAKTLTGTPTVNQYPPMPITIKTPWLPIITLPPIKQTGKWVHEQDGNNIAARFMNNDGECCGFALSGNACKRRLEFTKLMEGNRHVSA